MIAGADGRDLASVLARADDYAARGDVRSAVAFYQAALKSIRDPRALDQQMVARLQRAQAFIAARAREFQDALEQAVATAHPENALEALRLQHSLEMLKGQRQVYQQQPSAFYYPYLAQRQFFEREEFGWVEAFEEAAPEIRRELESLLEADAGFDPYVEDDPDRPYRDFHGLNEDRSWTALYLWKHGKVVEDHAKRCPKTIAALENVPLTRIGAWSPAVLFSRLEAGAHIPPHTGMANFRLICHLPLIVPKGCWLRVGNETRQWEEGKLLIFDDSMEHEAKNPTGELRIILLFDIWRPELGEAERAAVSTMFDAIERFQGTPEQ